MTTTTATMYYTSQNSKVQFAAEQKFDPKRFRHYLNGRVSVLHCHHYSTLFTQLALDAENLKGIELLMETSTESLGSALREYYRQHRIKEIEDRIAIAEQYYGFIGLGQVSLSFGEGFGKATMKHSHVDEGWLKKWGPADKPVNFIGLGYLRGAWGAIFDKNPAKVRVEETQSIVRGAATSVFTFCWPEGVK